MPHLYGLHITVNILMFQHAEIFKDKLEAHHTLSWWWKYISQNLVVFIFDLQFPNISIHMLELQNIHLGKTYLTMDMKKHKIRVQLCILQQWLSVSGPCQQLPY